MPDDYWNRVCKVAFVKYALDEVVMDGFYEDIKMCWESQYTPIRTVEYIAERIF